MRNLQIHHGFHILVEFGRHSLLYDSFHLDQFRRQRVVIAQSSRSIHQQHIVLLFNGLVERSIQHGRRTIGSIRGREAINLGAIRPLFQLGHGAGAKGVACREQYLVVGFGFETVGEFANGGGFAHAVGAHDEVDGEWFGGWCAGWFVVVFACEFEGEGTTFTFISISLVLSTAFQLFASLLLYPIVLRRATSTRSQSLQQFTPQQSLDIIPAKDLRTLLPQKTRLFQNIIRRRQSQIGLQQRILELT
mmetsp:Transcript_215/g.414  ORF Transcript_215/g.414 Transcript_215/m.414 type:complete len:248 (+) Transcript_215:555-1298(+)